MVNVLQNLLMDVTYSDVTSTIDLDYGKVEGISGIIPIPDKPDEFHLTIRNMFTFPA